EVGTQRLLWEDANPWRDAWSARLPRDGLVPIVLPAGDVQDVGALSADQAVGGDAKRLKAMMERIGAFEAVVARAKLVPEGPVGAPEVQVDAVRHGAGPPQATVERLRANPGEGAAAMLQRAVEAIAGQIEERWKRENAYGQAERVVEAVVPIRSVREWNEVRARLGRVGAVKRSDLVEISKAEARLRLLVAATDAAFAAALAQQDLQADGQGAERTIRLVGAAAAALGAP
ncbi:MAG: DUF2066 domain-containing protein, partial [Alphaproteobacteria bacterium]|nr:DUF2066 domain-containing protein [Alphaproteobacteria bacterium]